MESPRSVAVTGVGMSYFQKRRGDADLFGLMQEVAEEGLADAGLTMADVDAVVLSQAPDALHGIGHPEQTAPAHLALAGKPVLRAHTGGLTGLSAAQVGWWAVASGRFESVLVVGADKMGDALTPAQTALNEIWDPAYERALPLNAISMCALSATRYMHEYGATMEQFAAIATRLRANGTRNERAHLRMQVSVDEALEGPICWPITRVMACPQSSGGCAVVMTSAEATRASAAPAAWVRGFACRSNTYFMGDKMGHVTDNDHATPHELALAAREAYEMAGIRQPANEIDVVEPYVPFAVLEPGVLEALQLAEPGTAAAKAASGEFDLEGAMPVNPSGGTVCTNPIAVTALVRFAEAAQQVRGRAGGHQVHDVRTAVATGVGGSLQFYGAAVLSQEPTRG